MNYTIKVFHADNCQPCRLTMKRLDKDEILYDSTNISYDEEARNYLKEKGFRQTPVVEIYDFDGKIIDAWSGLNMPKMNKYFVKG